MWYTHGYEKNKNLLLKICVCLGKLSDGREGRRERGRGVRQTKVEFCEAEDWTRRSTVSCRN